VYIMEEYRYHVRLCTVWKCKNTVYNPTSYPYSSILYTIIYSISTLPYCTLSYVLFLHFHTVHNLTWYLYSSIMYTILHSISTLPHYTLSYFLSLLLHTVHHGGERQGLVRLSPRFAPSQINSIFAVNRPILYLSCNPRCSKKWS
jgi:hypothetical protein